MLLFPPYALQNYVQISLSWFNDGKWFGKVAVTRKVVPDLKQTSLWDLCYLKFIDDTRWNSQRRWNVSQLHPLSVQKISRWVELRIPPWTLMCANLVSDQGPFSFQWVDWARIWRASQWTRMWVVCWGTFHVCLFIYECVNRIGDLNYREATQPIAYYPAPHIQFWSSHSCSC